MKEFCKLLDAMVEDEKKASQRDYEELYDALVSIQVTGPESIDYDSKRLGEAIIASIKTDEAKHYMLLSQLKGVVC